MIQEVFFDPVTRRAKRARRLGEADAEPYRRQALPLRSLHAFAMRHNSYGGPWAGFL